MLSIGWKKYTLEFRKPAGTSRGSLKEKTVWFIRIRDSNRPWTEGIGECGPLPGLSLDDFPDFEARMDEACRQLEKYGHPDDCDLSLLPSVQFAFETALNDLANGGKRLIFKNSFWQSEAGIPINGLVWMNEKETMYQEALEKVSQGYSCLKFKVGAIDFDEECRLLESVRKLYNPFRVEIRVDANGAFTADDAMEKLRDLSRFSLHSIEQPVRKGQVELMQELCAKSPVHIALDEELIGVDLYPHGDKLLRTIDPDYLVLKPSLLGGFNNCDKWIQAARKHHKGWWITSALESNIGLNAIAQYTANHPIMLQHGLGTGKLYLNNIGSPLDISQGKLFYRKEHSWDTAFIED